MISTSICGFKLIVHYKFFYFQHKICLKLFKKKKPGNFSNACLRNITDINIWLCNAQAGRKDWGTLEHFFQLMVTMC